jgi:catechol 2,3-dioxygenase-like lactoylglutathione lyase family enzyme
MSPQTNEHPGIANLIVRPHHVGVSVDNFDGALDFFVRVLGMRVLGEMDHRREDNLDHVVGLSDVDIRWAMLELNGFHIELFKYYSPEGQRHEIRQCDLGLTHLCFEVYNVDLVHERLAAQGYRSNSPPLELRNGRSKAVYASGPEGIVVEFLELRPWR